MSYEGTEGLKDVIINSFIFRVNLILFWYTFCCIDHITLWSYLITVVASIIPFNLPPINQLCDYLIILS